MNRATIVTVVVVVFLTGCNIRWPISLPRKQADIPLPTIAEISSPTPSATEEPPSPTPEPSTTATPTVAASATPSATPTMDLSRCKLAAAFVRDVSIPDNAVMTPGAKFIKTWEIKNTGTCTWTAPFALTYIKGQALSEARTVPMTGTVSGKVARISVEMTSPDKPGTYRSDWQMCAGSQCFGPALYVQIVVRAAVTPAPTKRPTSAQ
jgi:hypothetical protein